MLEWRKINKIDELLSNSFDCPEVFKKYFSYGRCGSDKKNCPGKKKIAYIALNENRKLNLLIFLNSLDFCRWPN